MRVPSKVNLSSRKAGLLVTVALVGASLAGCAESSRLSDPFGNPFEASSRRVDRAPVASTPRPSTNSPTYNAPLGRVQSRPLSAPSWAAVSIPSAIPLTTVNFRRTSSALSCRAASSP